MTAVVMVSALPTPPSEVVRCRPRVGRLATLVLGGQLLTAQLLLASGSHAAEFVEPVERVESIEFFGSSESSESSKSLEPTTTTEPADCEDHCVTPGEWEFGLALGFGYAPNPLADGEDIHLPVLPHFSYYGERFFIETGSLGYTLTESASQRLNLLARPNLDYFYFAGSGTFYSVLTHPFRYGVAGELSERELTYLGGVEYSWFHGSWQVQASAGTDISVGHDGSEATLNGKYSWQHNDSSLQVTLGLLYRDEKISNYYYGITDAETSWLEKRYQPGATLSPYASITGQQQLTENFSLLLLLAAQRPDGAITASPLVTERWFVAGFFGLAYVF